MHPAPPKEAQEPELYWDRVAYAGWPFDLHNPKGWFRTEILERIDRKQERLVWGLTHSGLGGQRPRVQAGGEGDKNILGGKNTPAATTPTPDKLWGPKLSDAEVKAARQKAPKNENGVLLCCNLIFDQTSRIA